MGEKEGECEERKAKLQEEKMLLRVLDGNFSNEETMTVLRLGLHQYESQQILLLTPERRLLLLTRGERQNDRTEGRKSSSQ